MNRLAGICGIASFVVLALVPIATPRPMAYGPYFWSGAIACLALGILFLVRGRRTERRK